MTEFVQIYLENEKCICDNEKCTNQIAEYYFSSVETRLLCTFHIETAPIMRSKGHPISKQYYNEVYYKE